MTRLLDDRSPKRVWAASERDHEAGARWCRKWAPECPDGTPWRVRRALAFRERNPCELELRVALGGDDDGVCQVVVEEEENDVYVRVLVHYEDDCPSRVRERDYLDWPVRVWLERPLGERAVIDVDSDAPLPRRVRYPVAAATAESGRRQELDSFSVSERERARVERGES